MAKAHAQLTARDIHDPYLQLLTNLQGNEGPVWLDALKVFLRKENPWPKRASEYQTWKTVATGGRPAEVWHRLLKKNRVDVEKDIIELCEKRMRDPQRTETDLVKLTVSDLGFPSPVFYRQAIKRAMSLGFVLCGIEQALALRLEYLDQPAGECIYVPIQGLASEWTLEAGPHSTLNGITVLIDHVAAPEDSSLEDSEEDAKGKLRLFHIREWAHNQNCYPTNKLVFVRPRK